MSNQDYILDNQNGRNVYEYLRRSLADADSLSAATAYFSIYGYELLKAGLNRLGETRLLLGEPASAASPDPGKQDAKAFDLTEPGDLEPTFTLMQRGLARDCKNWLRRDGVQARSMKRAGLMHGKAYLAGKGGAIKNGVAGSSNFTKRGLGGGANSNIELNLQSDDPATLAELQAWFDALWNDQERTEDVKQTILDALERLGENYSPEMVYFKTLYELFRREIEEAPHIGAARDSLAKSEIWDYLFSFQQDGALTAIDWLNRRNGCILADSVGLGKTYTALAVIKHFESQNQRVLVLCPRRLVRNWQRFQVNASPTQFAADRFTYTLLAHTDVGRESGKGSTQGIELDRFNWGAYDLIVIDESHNFRNASGKRYQWLMDRAIKAGGKTKVLMLSATPVNTSLDNIKSQIDLITAGDDAAFENSLGIADVKALLRDAEAQFKRWMGESAQQAATDAKPKPQDGASAKRELMDALGGEFIRLMTSVSVARSRKHLRAVYQADIDKMGDFPRRKTPRNEHPAALVKASKQESAKFYYEIAKALSELNLALYNPSKYVIGGADGRQRQREYNLVGMMRVNLLKRLESSTCAISATMGRIIDKLNAELTHIDNRQAGARQSLTGDAIFTQDDEGDEDAADAETAAADDASRFDLTALNLDEYRAALQADRDTLADLLAKTQPVQGDADGKLVQFKADVEHRIANPSAERDGKQSRKLLVFTTFKDTAEYIYKQLTCDQKFAGANIAMVSGTETHTTFRDDKENNFDKILDNFAPRARHRDPKDKPSDEGIDILIATDCVSEGQDLQDCDMVLNYDIHWNPVRVIQRFGRVDRIGSPHKTIEMINYWPAKEMKEYLRLEALVVARAALANAAATGVDNALDAESPEYSVDDADAESPDDRLNDAAVAEFADYRAKQIQRIKDEALDIEDLEDAPTLTDLSAQFFIDQLRRFLAGNKRLIEAMPNGVFAVAPPAAKEDEPDNRPSVIFCLRRKSEIDARVKSASAAPPPFYLVSVYSEPDENGAVKMRLGCHRAYDVLRLFSAVAAGKAEPFQAMCDAVDRETQHGAKMDAYNALAQAALADIREREANAAYKAVVEGNKGALFPRQPEPNNDASSLAADFELITWCIIRAAE